MKIRGGEISPFFISVVIVITVTVAVCLFAVSCSSSLDYSAEYYLVCLYVRDNALSADTLSGTAASYGGAGYVIGYKDKYYVTISCYYDETSANSVCDSLKRRDLGCIVLCAERDEFTLKSYSAKKNSALYLGNLNTLNDLSALAYECANKLDTGSCSQSAAKSVISDVGSGLKGLKKANPANCFTGQLDRLLSECADISGGYVYSKDLRRLQIAIVDCVLNIELY